MAAAFVFAASCNKVEVNTVSDEGHGKTVINGVAEAIGNGTKAYNSYIYEVLWQEEDNIFVTKGDGTNDLFVLEEGEGTPNGKFVEKGDKGITGEIEAFYPASLKTDAGSTISKPEDPEVSGHVFRGWYKDFNCKFAWDFDTDTVTRDLVLFAGWDNAM